MSFLHRNSLVLMSCPKDSYAYSNCSPGCGLGLWMGIVDGDRRLRVWEYARGIGVKN